jgi:hypothetical protein
MEYKYEFLASHIPQQDGIVENKKKKNPPRVCSDHVA